MPNEKLISDVFNKYEQKLIREFLSTTATLYYKLRLLNVEYLEADSWMDSVNRLMQEAESLTESWDADDEIPHIIPSQPYGPTLWGLFMEGWHHGRQGCGLTFCGCSNGSIPRDEHGHEVVSVYQQEGATDDVDEPNPQSSS